MFTFTAFSYSQPTTKFISEMKAKWDFEAQRWRGEGQRKVFCLWKETMMGRDRGGAGRWAENRSCNHETRFHIAMKKKVALNISSCPGLNYPNYQHGQA